jgi:hypothetical protein
VNGNAGGDRIGQAELVSSRNPVDQQSSLVPACYSVDNCGVIGIGGFAGELVDSWQVIEAPVDTPDLVGDCQSLQSFVDSRAGPKPRKSLGVQTPAGVA